MTKLLVQPFGSQDIRFATNGIEVNGMPAHSPLLGQIGEQAQPAAMTLRTQSSLVYLL